MCDAHMFGNTLYALSPFVRDMGPTHTGHVPRKAPDPEKVSPQEREVRLLLGKEIKKLRQQAGQNQEVLAAAAQMDQGGWSKIENGKQGISGERLYWLAKALGQPIFKLFGGYPLITELPGPDAVDVAWRWENLSIEHRKFVSDLVDNLTPHEARKMHQQQPQARRKRGDGAGD